MSGESNISSLFIDKKTMLVYYINSTLIKYGGET